MDIQGNFYRCHKCSRITQSYPFGCRESQCPVKKDVMNDWTYGFFISLVLILLFAFAYLYVFVHAFGIIK